MKHDVSELLSNPISSQWESGVKINLPPPPPPPLLPPFSLLEAFNSKTISFLFYQFYVKLSD